VAELIRRSTLCEVGIVPPGVEIDRALVIEETRLRFSAGAVRVTEGLVVQHGNKDLFPRNRHLAMGFNPDPRDLTPRYVFIPRDLGYASLHELVRGAIGEALDYRFRYRNVAPLTFVVVFSRAVSNANDEAIAMLNHYKILVVDYDDEEERYRLQGRFQIGNAGEDFHWLRVPKHHVIISETPSFGDEVLPVEIRIWFAVIGIDAGERDTIDFQREDSALVVLIVRAADTSQHLRKGALDFAHCVFEPVS